MSWTAQVTLLLHIDISKWWATLTWFQIVQPNLVVFNCEMTHLCVDPLIWWRLLCTWLSFVKTTLHLTSKLITVIPNHLYLRPVLAFEYCHCLHLCVNLCVNHFLFRAITWDPLKLGSPNLAQRCKTTWLRSLLFCEAIDLDLQGHIFCEWCRSLWLHQSIGRKMTQPAALGASWRHGGCDWPHMAR